MLFHGFHGARSRPVMSAVGTHIPILPVHWAVFLVCGARTIHAALMEAADPAGGTHAEFALEETFEKDVGSPIKVSCG